MSSKRYRPWNPDQMVLFPQAMKDALEEDHIVFRILDVVENLDLSSTTDRMGRFDSCRETETRSPTQRHRS